MKEPIDFKKEAKLKTHREKQKKLIEKIEEDNLIISSKIKEWESLNEKSVRLEKVYNLPEDIVKLMFQYNYNEKTLRQKYQRYKNK
jgi:hypothetical protein